ncbi:uncharacterized protein LOC118222124 isoform X2 [Anguilla anguilla]|uniref:uncharacterized protein LOC118222124 isoform X2 n=1 Tax=Anguilla anguilla TaxID=7936 RepID=UPI0015B237B2|nr:uncharacterized protein LOC118222124 isoform X2 [Anguilla anguilla]
MGWRYYFLYYFIWNAQYLASAQTIFKDLGESLIFPLGIERANISDAVVKKNSVYLFKWKRNEVNREYGDRLKFTQNKTLQLDKLEERDAGAYTVELFDMGGIQTRKDKITVILTCLKTLREVHGDLGGPVDVFVENLMAFSEPFDTVWEINGSAIARLNRSGPTYSEKPGGRVEMSPSGECRLTRVRISDAGNHTLEVSVGYLRLRWSRRLVVRVPQPSIDYSCLFGGKAKFRCRAKWEVPTVWILNGTGQGDRAPGHNDQVLDPFTGELICALEDYPDRNASVSFTCIGLDLATTACILAVCCTFIIVLILSSAGFYIRLKQRRRNQSLQPTAMVPAEDIYSSVAIYVVVSRVFHPPPPSAQEKTSYRISQPVEMSTLIYRPPGGSNENNTLYQQGPK